MRYINPPPMIWLKLALSLILFAGVVLLIWRRAPFRINRSFPPLGQFITVQAAKVHYHQTGSGPDVILLHGASGNLREWEFGLRAALEGSYRVTAFDRPGHGYSDVIAGNAHLSPSAAHLRAAAETLGIKDFILVGHSYGGSVALAWALQAAPRGLMLISSPSLPWPGKLDPWYRMNKIPIVSNILVRLAALLVPMYYIEIAVRHVFAPASMPPEYVRRMGLALTLRPRSMRANVAQVNTLLGDIRAQMADYSRLKMPIEVIHGDRDIIVPAAIHSIPLAAALPHAHLTLINGAGHMPHHSHMDQVIAVLARLCNPS
jgi:pimeloyl-ACP methyl ester carboxylesterase